MTFTLLKGLLNVDNLQLSVILFNDGKLADEIRGLNIPVVIVSEKETTFANTFFAARKALNQINPSIIHSHRSKENILAYLLAAGRRDVSLVSTQHGIPEVHGRKKSLKSRAVAKLNTFVLSKYFKVIVAVSKDIQKALIDDFGYRESMVEVIYNGTEIFEDHLLPQQNGSFVIGSAGRLFPVKDYALMVEIAREVSKRTSHIRFVLAGDGPEKVRLERLVKEYGLEKTFLFSGFIDNINIFNRGLDIYINTSSHEGIPMSILEAMSFSVPVLAPNVGGLAEIIENGVQGFLIDTRNPADFAEKCIALCENGALRREMGIAAKKRILERISIEHMTEEYHRLYFRI
jgi:glycosyltransferase involved in cell wall biosynthesis